MDRDQPGNKKQARRWLSLLRRNTRGATAVEYGLIVAMIVIAMIGALSGLADTTSGMWNSVSTKVITH